MEGVRGRTILVIIVVVVVYSSSSSSSIVYLIRVGPLHALGPEAQADFGAILGNVWAILGHIWRSWGLLGSTLGFRV